tara:strand:- start:4472 stop:4810 length:339 start_codon:yes stop_codon:yes gene_type:complete
MTNFFHRLGNKIAGVAHRAGVKAHHAIHQGAKFVAKHADSVANIADKVGNVAGVVGKVASAALPFTAEIPGVGEVVAGAAAAGKVIERGARMTSKGARVAGKVSRGMLAAGI